MTNQLGCIKYNYTITDNSTNAVVDQGQSLDDFFKISSLVNRVGRYVIEVKAVMEMTPEKVLDQQEFVLVNGKILGNTWLM